tara:strand:- start:1551 stop:3356 length:1806 start_codon:yes stop_codon:yes gene_type:complete
MYISRQDLKILLFISGAVSLVYFQVLDFQFVNYDDELYVVHNPRVNSGLKIENVSWAFTNAYAANWHPLTWISHMVDVEWFGLNPAGHHAVNVALHLFNSCFLFLLLKTMTGAVWRPATVAALFALHPLHVEPVVWISQRKEMLSFAFGVVLIWTYFCWTERRSISLYLMTILIFACCLMSKTMWVTFPALLILLDRWPLNRLNKTTFLRRILEKIPYFTLSVGSVWITVFSQRAGLAIRTMEEYPLWIRIENAFTSYVIYLCQTIFPNHLMVFYSHPKDKASFLFVVAEGLLLVGITLWAIKGGSRALFLKVGWLWYVITLIPVIGLVQIGQQAHADRYTYLPHVGVFVAIVWSTEQWVFNKNLRKRLVTVAAVTILTAFAVLSHQQSLHWRNSLTLYEHILSIDSDNPLAIQNYSESLAERAKMYWREGRWKKAEADLDTALEVRPGMVKVEVIRGNLLAMKGQLDQAALHYRRAIEKDSSNINAYRNLGAVLLKTGDDDGAANSFREALARKPSQPSIRNNLGSILYRKRKVVEAEEQFRRAVKLSPENSTILYNLAMALADQGKRNEAARYLRSALKVTPRFSKALYLLRKLHPEAE